ncbi:MAG: phage tail protein [Gammaproteobacteria bacterium]|nr:phage tail protein [Gammaproteobacteria bacterium]
MSGEPLDFYTSFNFIVEIDGVRRAGFNSMSELGVEIGVVEYHEGGRDIPHKRPGKRSYANVTLERGATDDRDLYDWVNQMTNATTGRGQTADAYKKNVDVVQLDRDGSARRRWTLFNAFPSGHKAGEWDATSEEATMENLVLTYDYFQIA